MMLLFSCFLLNGIISLSMGREYHQVEIGTNNYKYCPPGTYKSSYNNANICLDCPKGTFGETFDLTSSDCSGRCKAGYYGGRVGEKKSECTGPCSEGYFCPEGSTKPTEKECGGFQYYCPPSSGDRILADKGYYTVGGPENGINRVDQKLCEEGYFCENGKRFPCPAGTYNPRLGGENIHDCSDCPKGFYCPEKSTKPIKCKPGSFGEIEGLKMESCSGLCSKGHYCPESTVNVDSKQHKCPAGRFADEEGMINSICSKNCDQKSGVCVSSESECEAGYYCPEGSTSAQQYPCGNSSVYCPRKSGLPVQVDEGYYGRGENEETQTNQKLCEKGYYCVDGKRFACPAGTFGDSEGQSTDSCSGLCTPGFYCPSGSISKYEYRCGAVDKYCPQGSSEPQNVTIGYYTIEGSVTTRENEKICEPGFYCDKGLKFKIPAGYYGSIKGLSTKEGSGICPEGHYCPANSIRPIKCPAGTYGSTKGLMDSKCSGLCSAGYFCLEGSTNQQQFRCSSHLSSQVEQEEGIPFGGEPGKYYGNVHGEYGKKSRDNVYCPMGSSQPIQVDPGYFAVGGSEGARSSQIECNRENDYWDEDSSSCNFT